MNKHKSNKRKENSNAVRHLIMGQISTTQNLVAIKEVRHAGQWLFCRSDHQVQSNVRKTNARDFSSKKCIWKHRLQKCHFVQTPCISRSHALTVGELRSGVTGFATIYATGSHRFMWQVRNDERDEVQSSTEKKGEYYRSLAHVCYHLPLKCHRVLSDFQAGYSHQETINRNIQS